MTPFSPELMQTLEDLIPAICVSVAMAVIVYIAFLHNALINARQTCKDQGNMLAEYVHLQADDLIKVQNAHKNESAAMRKYNELMRDYEIKNTEAAGLAKSYQKLMDEKDEWRQKASEAMNKYIGTLDIYEHSSKLNDSLIAENIALKDKISRKNEPRDAKGHFAKSVAVKKNPNIGKYLCNYPTHNFILGCYYERYEHKDINRNNLVLIGDDRQRHSVLLKDFQLITE